MVVVIVGNLLVALLVVGSGFVGAQWHVGFPVFNRFVFGMFGSFLPLMMRIMLSFVWYSVQLWFGGQSVKVVLGALSPRFLNWNTFPASAAMTSADFVGFVVFTLISLPLIAVPPEHYRKPFVVGSVSITVTALAILVWALAAARGAGPLLTHAAQFSGVAPISSSAQLGWTMTYGISTVIGGICAGILNQSDYTRFAVKPTDQIVSQLFIVPISASLTALIGILVTSAAAKLYPDAGLLWAPYDLLQAVQQNGGPGARAGVFFAGLSFVVAQLFINVAGNAISGGIDLSGLLPRYFNIRRGAYLTSVIGVALCPWYMLNRPSTFLTVLSSFAVFLAPLSGCMIAEYIVIRNWTLKLSDLYRATPESIYWYTYGVNPRAIFAFAMGVWPLMPGFVAAVQERDTSQGWLRTYQLAYPLGFCISATLQISLGKIFPPVHLGVADERDVFGTFTDASRDGESAVEVVREFEEQDIETQKV